jgi:dephospho-CoA kinase
LHPLIREEVAARIERVDQPYAIVVVPLLIETGGYSMLCQRVLVVDCREETQADRTMRRSGLTEDQVRAILAVQASREARLRVADDVIHNEGTIEELNRQVDRLHQSYLALARH